MHDIKIATFYLLIIVVYLCSGSITMLTVGIFPYKMMYVTLPIIPIIIHFGIPINRLLVISSLLFIVIIFSGIINSISIIDIVLFLRNIVGAYLAVYMAETFLKSRRVMKVFKIILFITVIQLPIVIVQKLSYNIMPNRIKNAIVAIDYDFGTFNFKADHSLAFFIILILITILMNRNIPISRMSKIIIAFLCTATVLIVNSKISHLILLFVWIVFLLQGRKNRVIPLYQIVFLSIPFVCIFMISNNISNSLLNQFREAIFHLRISGESSDITTFTEGGYSRAAALYYYIFQRDLIIIGDGPGRYFNPLTSIYQLGNTGHLFTFYAEIGIMGLVLSYIFFIEIMRRGFYQVKSSIKLMFVIVMMAYSTTVFIMSDITFALTLFLLSRINAYFISNKDMKRDYRSKFSNNIEPIRV